MVAQNLAAFKQSFSGALFTPDDAGYDEARAVLYGGDAQPAVVVRPRDTAGVAQAIAYACEHKLALAVRSGGHSGAGFSTVDGGLVIDVRDFHDIEILDEAHGLVRVGAGATWEQVAATLDAHHLAISAGDTRSVGVSGLALNGGVGWLVRRDGLALDALREIELVTADGQILTASATDHADLFWALRGAGGNFGVATRLTFQAHPLDGVVSGQLFYSADNVPGLITAWRDIMRTAPEVLNTTFMAMPSMAPTMPAGVMIWCVYAGTDEAVALQTLEPFLKLPGLKSHNVKPKPYREVLEEAHPPQGVTVVTNNAFAPDLSDELIVSLGAFYASLPASVLMMRYVRGAFNRVEPDDTAFSYRDGEVLIISAAFLPPGTSEIQLTERWAEMAGQFHGSYSGFFNSPTLKDLTQLYPTKTLERLVQVKRQYDPDNLFRHNYNIVPAQH